MQKLGPALAYNGRMLVSLGARRMHDGDVVDLLLDCHERIRRFTALAQRVGRSDTVQPAPSAHEVAEACEQIDRYFSQALPLHVRDEEESLWPRLRGHRAPIDEALERMHAQHEQHGPLLQALREACKDLRREPENAALKLELAGIADALAKEFAEHLALEEDVLFPAVRQLLNTATQADIVHELRARRA